MLLGCSTAADAAAGGGGGGGREPGGGDGGASLALVAGVVYKSSTYKTRQHSMKCIDTKVAFLNAKRRSLFPIHGKNFI